MSARRVAVIYGGNSIEAEVSRKSAEGVYEALVVGGYDPWLTALDDVALTESVRAAEVVFPVAHGRMGEDGCLQGFLEVLSVAYVGSGVRASAAAAYKPVANALFRAAGLMSPACITILAAEVGGGPARVLGELPGPVVVKPAAGGSGIGVTLLRTTPDERALRQALAVARIGDGDVIVQRFITGDEVTCGVLEDETGRPQALPATFVEPLVAEWYDFKARYSQGGSRHVCPAPYDAETSARIASAACAAHVALGARDLSRTDFVVTKTGEVHVLEVNTLPGMTPASNFPEAAQAAGIPFPELCSRLVERAWSRPRPELESAVQFPS